MSGSPLGKDIASTLQIARFQVHEFSQFSGEELTSSDLSLCSILSFAVDLGFALNSWEFRAIGSDFAFNTTRRLRDSVWASTSIAQQRRLDKALFASNLNYLATLNAMPLTQTVDICFYTLSSLYQSYYMDNRMYKTCQNSLNRHLNS